MFRTTETCTRCGGNGYPKVLFGLRLRCRRCRGTGEMPRGLFRAWWFLSRVFGSKTD